MKSCNHKHLAAPTQLSLKGLKQQQYNLLVNFCCYICIKYILGCIIIDLASGADYNAHYSSSQYGFCSCIHLRLCLFIFFSYSLQMYRMSLIMLQQQLHLFLFPLCTMCIICTNHFCLVKIAATLHWLRENARQRVRANHKHQFHTKHLNLLHYLFFRRKKKRCRCFLFVCLFLEGSV